jgi:hypothetical protein
MRELNTKEIVQVSGGSQSGYDTMSFPCFASWVFLGVSPAFGIGAIASAGFSVITNCSNS